MLTKYVGEEFSIKEVNAVFNPELYTVNSFVFACNPNKFNVLPGVGDVDVKTSYWFIGR
jgi:hypothetical protein